MPGKPTPLRIEDGSVVAVIGSGPAGCFFALLAMKEAEARGIRIRTVMFDGKSFLQEGPRGCNMCAGVISRNLLKEIERIGLRIPEDRVQRRIDSYVFHTNEGSHKVVAPPGMGSIPVVFRGNGPRFSEEMQRISFDDFLLVETERRGAEIVPYNVEELTFSSGRDPRPRLHGSEEDLEADLVVVASGVASPFVRNLQTMGSGYHPPRTVRAFQAELDLGDAALADHLGNSIHVFSLGRKDIRFAAIIPKARFATVSLVGNRDMGSDEFKAFLQTQAVRDLLPDDWHMPERHCSCRPPLPLRGATRFYGNRLVVVGDASVSRYYKNGIESAYWTSLYAVRSAFDFGLSEESLRRSYYLPVRSEFRQENLYARILFRLNDFVASKRFWVRAHMYFVRNAPNGKTAQTLNFLTWNLFTGNAPYRDLLRTSMNPRFFLKMIFRGLFPRHFLKKHASSSR
jgi:flavin-dependent dehydrogenase